MNILVSLPKWNGQVSGVEYHRCFIPFKNIPNVIFTDNIEAVSKEFLKDNDIGIVWFNRNIAPLTLNPDLIYRTLKQMGIKIVCDLDDNWNVGFGHVLYDPMIKMNLKNSNVSQIKAADYVCVTHEHLANLVQKELKVHKHRIIIAPNGIDPNEPQYQQDFSYKLENIFWQGSVTHHHDLKLISGAVNELDKKIFIAGYDPTSHKDITDYSKIDLSPDGHLFDDKPWVYMLTEYERAGHVPERLKTKIFHWEETGKMFNRKQWIHVSQITEYMNFYQNKGICLIPLEKNKFTVCKSNLKMLEAGWSFKPVIASGIHPYTTIGKDGVNCEFAGNKDSWKESIEYLLENPNYADDLRFKLHEDVKEKYLIDKVNESRIELINKIK